METRISLLDSYLTTTMILLAMVRINWQRIVGAKVPGEQWASWHEYQSFVRRSDELRHARAAQRHPAQ